MSPSDLARMSVSEYAKIRSTLFENAIPHFNIPAQYRGLSLADFTPSFDQLNATLACRDFSDNFRDHSVPPDLPYENYPADRSLIGKGLYLYGPYGTGKTMLACLTATSVANKFRRVVPFYVKASAYREAVQSTFNPNPSPESLEIIKRSKETLLLVLDDLGQEYHAAKGETTAWGSVLYAELFRQRYDAGRATVVTSNTPPDLLENRYGKSMNSFSHDAFSFVHVSGPDRRKEGTGMN